jgi:hypothetical protein
MSFKPLTSCASSAGASSSRIEVQIMKYFRRKSHPRVLIFTLCGFLATLVVGCSGESTTTVTPEEAAVARKNKADIIRDAGGGAKSKKSKAPRNPADDI